MTQETYPIPAATHRVEEEYSRSRFITTVGHAPTVEAARAFIDTVRSEFSDASHNCWAYVIGAPGSSGWNGMSDDGEPHGTAGRPMLTVLLHAGVGEIVAVVTRYFGGTLLGKGGLVKAYSGGVQLALQTLPTALRVPKTTVQVVLEYGAVTLFKRILEGYAAAVLQEEFAQDASFVIELPVAERDRFVEALTELTSGQALIV